MHRQGLVPWSLEAHTAYTPVHVIGWERVDADTTQRHNTETTDTRTNHKGGRAPQSLTGPYPIAYPIA